MKEHKRILYFDNLRAILMLLVVVSHAASVFSVNEYWRVLRSLQTTYFADFLFLATQSFKMPAFFIISGYLAMHSLLKYNTKEFLKKRFIRIGVPLIFVALTFNSLQEYLLIKFNYINDFNLKEYILGGHWKHHLWFLINLLFYFLFLALFKNYLINLNKKLFNIYNISLYLLLFLLPFATVALLALAKIYPLRGIINSSVIVMFLPFFLFGVMLKNNEHILEELTKIPFFLSFIVVLLAIAFEQSFSHLYHTKSWQALTIYIIFLGKWFATAAILKFAFLYLNRHSKLLHYFRKASYSIYLTHHLFIILFGILLINFHIGYLKGLLLLLLLTYITTIFLYNFIITKNETLYFLLNGVKRSNSAT